MQRCDRSNSDEDSDDNSGSSDDEENTSIRLIARDGSDTGSGTRVYSDKFQIVPLIFLHQIIIC